MQVEEWTPIMQHLPPFRLSFAEKLVEVPLFQANTDKCHSLRDYSNLEQTLTLNCSRIIVGNLL